MKYTVGNIGVASPISVNTGAPTDCRYVVRDKSAIIGTTKIDGKTVDNFKLTFKSGAAYTYYEGMLVYVESDQKVYILKGTRDETGKVIKLEFKQLTPESSISEQGVLDILQTNNYINKSTLTNTLNNYVTSDKLTDLLTGLYKIKGVVDNPDLLPSKASVGDVYNIRDRFTIEITLLDGSKQLKTYPSGTNVVWIEYEEEQQKKNEKGELEFDENDAPVMETVKKAHWDALGGVSDFDWIDVTAYPEPEPEPEPEPTT